jgi:hypothetical protein
LMHLVRIYRNRTGRAAAPVPFVDGGHGDYNPGALLTPAVPPPAVPRAPRARLANAAPAGAKLLSVCAAVASGALEVAVNVSCQGYTAACQARSGRACHYASIG